MDKKRQDIYTKNFAHNFYKSKYHLLNQKIIGHNNFAKMKYLISNITLC